MGCDIHSVAEYRFTPTQPGWGPGTWQTITECLWPNWFFRSDLGVHHGNAPFGNAPFTDRNYSLFGALAGVRRMDYPMLAAPRGVPDNASSGWREIVEKWSDDLHSISYFTVPELEDAIHTYTELEKDDLYPGAVSADIIAAIAPLRRPDHGTNASKFEYRIMFGFDN